MPAKNLKRINDTATYSHIYNRGVEGRAIFNGETDYQVFLDFLKDYLTPKDPGSIKKDFKVRGRIFQGTPHLPKNYLNDIELVAYSLTADRFDLILHQKTSGSIERFLRSLCTRYSMYFNKKYHRSGALFEGPYKSVQIKDEHGLSNLTASLHNLSNNSSYPEYLGSGKTPWVKPQVVLSLFKNGSDYKDFVEKYRPDQPDQKEKESTEQLERSLKEKDLASEPDLPAHQDSKVRSRIPQFLTISTLVFIMLVTFSLWNINVSTAEGPKPQPTPAVLSETQEATPLKVEATPSATPEATASAEPEVKPETTLTVKISDGSPFVNIRQKPALSSEKIGQANNGENFEFISLQAGWYEIKLDDGTTGFISARYALKEETNQ